MNLRSSRSQYQTSAISTQKQNSGLSFTRQSISSDEPVSREVGIYQQKYEGYGKMPEQVICSRVANGECYHDCEHRKPHEQLEEVCTIPTYCKFIKKKCQCIPYDVVNKE